jgi:hypothetical protein
LERLQALPQARTERVPVRIWRTDRALAERTAMNMAANDTFLTMTAPFLSGTSYLVLSCG